MKKNKKSQLEDFLPLILALIVITIFFISCSPLQKRSQNVIQKDISNSINDINADDFLLDYLSREVEVSIGIDKKKISFSDLIVYSYLNNNFDEWKKLTKEFLEKYKTSSAEGWNMKIYLLPSEKKIESVITYETITLFGTKKGHSTAVIPLLNTDTQLKIELYKICQKGTC